MRPPGFDESAWRRHSWLGLLIAASAALSLVFTCITPFAAFAVIGATSLSRWNAVRLTVVLWLANQAVGFGVLHYPWTARTVAWGVAIGGSAVVGTLAAQWAVARLGAFRPWVQALGAFVPEIVGRVFVVNALTLACLHGLNQLVAAAGYSALRGRSEVSPARFVSR